MKSCPLFTVKPLSTVSVANVEVKIVKIGDEFIAGAIARLPDYMDVLEQKSFTSRAEAETWFNAKVRELFEACGHQFVPQFKIAS